jgi:hypothetical protein
MLVCFCDAFIEAGKAGGELILDGGDRRRQPVEAVVDLVEFLVELVEFVVNFVKFLEENGRKGRVVGKFPVEGGSVRFQRHLDMRGGGVIRQVSVGKVTNNR